MPTAPGSRFQMLSFAKNSSSSPLCGEALISMMEAAQFAYLDNSATVHHAAFDRTLLAKSPSGCATDGKWRRYAASVLFKCRAFRITKWFRHSLRIDPSSRSAYPFCQGLCGAVRTSRIPSDSSRRRTLKGSPSARCLRFAASRRTMTRRRTK